VQRYLLELVAQRTPGDPLPADREVAEKFQCSLQPVVRAMDELVRAGLIERRSGRRTVVLRRQPIFAHTVLAQSGMNDLDFSFGHSARELYGHPLENRVIELARRPIRTTPEHAFERDALDALGLERTQELYVIARVRVLDGVPKALHRSYLNPAHFPPDFLADNDFVASSLIGIFNRYGYRVASRDTVLCARYPSEDERFALKVEHKPVLGVEQTLEATEPGGGKSVTLEFLHALYVEWKYRITHRPAEAGEEKD
jgi:GntR family transcriptional regulator